jgi:hypothetical protein
MAIIITIFLAIFTVDFKKEKNTSKIETINCNMANELRDKFQGLDTKSFTQLIKSANGQSFAQNMAMNTHNVGTSSHAPQPTKETYGGISFSQNAPLPTEEIGREFKSNSLCYPTPKTKLEVLFKYYKGDIQDINDLNENLFVKERRETMLYCKFLELEPFKVFSCRSLVFTRFIARISTKIKMSENDIRKHIFK